MTANRRYRVVDPGGPLPSLNSLRTHAKPLTSLERVIYSFRGFTVAASLLIPASHLLLAASESLRAADPVNLEDASLKVLLEESMLDYVVIQTRRMFDRTHGALGALQLSKLLARHSMRADVIKHAAATGRGTGFMLDEIAADQHLRFVHFACTAAMTRVPPAPGTAPRIAWIAEYFRRAANKRTAHMTLDAWVLDAGLLAEMLANTVVIARCIQRVAIDDVYEGDYAAIDRSAFHLAAKTVGFSHSRGPLLAGLDDAVDAYVAATQ